MRDTAIDRIMTEDPETIGPGDSASAARALLESAGVHHLPVVEDGKLSGIVSSADFLKLSMLGEHVGLSAHATVEQIMEPNPIVLPAATSLRDAAEKLMVGGFHALPVVDEQRMLVGIVTSGDLIDALLKSLPVGDGSIIEAPGEDLSDLIDENRKLRKVCKAAELYVRSGHGEREHGVLVKYLADIRRSKDTVAI